MLIRRGFVEKLTGGQEFLSSIPLDWSQDGVDQ